MLAIARYHVFAAQQQGTAVGLIGANGAPAQQLAEMVWRHDRVNVTPLRIPKAANFVTVTMMKYTDADSRLVVWFLYLKQTTRRLDLFVTSLNFMSLRRLLTKL